MEHAFQPLGDGRQFCPGCGLVVRAPGRIFAGECSGAMSAWQSSIDWQPPCRYLGPLSCVTESKCCGGETVLTEHFGCSHPLHESTTESGCLTCVDYRLANDRRTTGERAGGLAIGIITAPRAVPTLGATIKSLRRAGLDHWIDVFAEPGAPTRGLQADLEFSVHQNQQTLGCYGNWLRAARWLLDNTTAPYFLLCEDDVEFCDGAAAALWGGLGQLPDIGYLSLYTPQHNIEVAGVTPAAGWQPLEIGGKAWGALAWCFPRAVLDHVVRNEPTPPRDGTDQIVTFRVSQTRKVTYSHFPSLARHTGSVSSLGHPSKPGFRAVGYQRWWRGPKLQHDPLSVAFLTPSILVGGVEHWFLSLAKFSDPARVRWSVGLTNPAASDPAMLKLIAPEAPIAVGPLAISRLVGNADVVVAWGLPHPRELLGQFAGPLVVVSHGDNAWTSDWMATAIDERTHVAAVSKVAASVCPGPARIIDNGIDLDRCQPRAGRAATRQAWGLADDEIALGYVGRISPEKNCLAVARVAAELGPPYRSVFVGPPYAGQYVDAIKRADPRAIFTGPAEHVGDAYAALDVLVMASPAEGSCLVVLEALAAGVPLVGTPVGLLPELRAKYGRLFARVPINPTVDQIKMAIATLPDANRRERAKAVVAEHYSAERMAADWTEYLEQIMADEPEGFTTPGLGADRDSVPLAVKGLHFARALGRRFVQTVKGGETYVGDDVYTARLAVCDGCPLRKADECSHPDCGCNLIRKARWATEDCPIAKWPPQSAPAE